MSDESKSLSKTIQKDLVFPIGLDDYSDIKLSSKTKQRLSDILISSRVGLVSSSPLNCEGPDNCSFKSRCPIYLERDKDTTYPINRQCIVEVNLIQDRFLAYTEELNKDSKVLDSLTYRSQISALVDLDLREFRTNMILAGVGGISDGTLLHEQTIALNEDGDEIKQLQEHPAWKNLVRIQKMRMELLDAMGLTVKRDAMIKAALHQKEADNFLTKSIDLLESITNLEKSIIES
jgi:hypothetical protein